MRLIPGVRHYLILLRSVFAGVPSSQGDFVHLQHLASSSHFILTFPDRASRWPSKYARSADFSICSCAEHPDKKTTEPNKAMQRTPTLVTRRKILVFDLLFMVEKVFRYSVGVRQTNHGWRCVRFHRYAANRGCPLFSPAQHAPNSHAWCVSGFREALRGDLEELVGGNVFVFVAFHNLFSN